VSITITDLFCGAGGSSLGAEKAGGTLRLGLNHWDRAIESHAANFPNAEHDCEDVSSLTTSQIRRYPDSDILLASPECTNHSLAKGARRRKPQRPSMFDDGPAGDDEQDRSRATMWDVVRFAEQKLLKGKPYKAIVVENVVDAYRWGYDDDGGLFQAWMQAMTALGYEHEIVWLNSMFCPPTPQSRDRMYIVFWQRKIRRPNLRIDPVSWCPKCERIVEGRQAFKPANPRAKKPVAKRYGVQYRYACPDCGGTVLPGAFPAASAIDWAAPRRDPGWARRAEDEPFGSVTTRDHHTLVVPYDRTGVARFTEEEPTHTLTQRDRLALIVPRAEEHVPELPLSWDDEDIDSCRFRMFALHEIASVMSMRHHINGTEYIVLGNKRERMAQYGNAVTPPVPALLVSRLLEVVA
jgi:DNA (cytosine-5)-methyltransferase 1